MLKRFAVKFIMSFIGWEPVLILLLQFLYKYLSSLQAKWELSTKMKMLVQMSDVIAMTFGTKWAKETKTPIDDDVVKNVHNLCVDIASDHGFELHVISKIG